MDHKITPYGRPTAISTYEAPENRNSVPEKTDSPPRLVSIQNKIDATTKGPTLEAINAFSLACHEGSLVNVITALNDGMPVDARVNRYCPSGLCGAVSQGHTTIVSLLLDHGAGNDKKDVENAIALANDYPAIQALLNSALQAPVQRASLPAATVPEFRVINSMAKPARSALLKPTNDQINKFLQDAKDGRLDLVIESMNKFDIINATVGTSSLTALSRAAKYGKLAVVEHLLAHGANDSSKFAALSETVFNHDKEMAKVLLNSFPDPVAARERVIADLTTNLGLEDAQCSFLYNIPVGSAPRI